MWKMGIPLKIKLFIWKACNDWIPTKGNLGRRGIPCDGICPICSKSLEHTLHALWDCYNLRYARVCGGCQGTLCGGVEIILMSYAELNVRGRRGRTRRAGEGLRNDRGRVLACCAQSCEANYEVECAKVMAVYKGLMYCREIGVEKYIVETDSDSVINQIVTGGSSESRYGGILDSIQGMVSNSRTVSFRCVSAKANRVAWVLAGEAVGLIDRVLWKEVTPMCIKALVEDEQRI
ncbi:hypothetical protein LWI29_013325 [Acer saccharum]|uniref:RNase H type-1 domain-containing protein n=1 Tax=Acer saccharum TaxID=4024 RepID=A0AA39RUQ2_ACESA|nr:hypothetical protein LWI29_013325 [Acer saccharum]